MTKMSLGEDKEEEKRWVSVRANDAVGNLDFLVLVRFDLKVTQEHNPLCKGKLWCAHVCVHRNCANCVPSRLWNRGGLIFCVSQTHSFKTVTAHHQKETVTSHQVRDLQKKILKCKLQNVTVFSR